MYRRDVYIYIFNTNKQSPIVAPLKMCHAHHKQHKRLQSSIYILQLYKQHNSLYYWYTGKSQPAIRPKLPFGRESPESPLAQLPQLSPRFGRNTAHGGRYGRTAEHPPGPSPAALSLHSAPPPPTLPSDRQSEPKTAGPAPRQHSTPCDAGGVIIIIRISQLFFVRGKKHKDKDHDISAGINNGGKLLAQIMWQNQGGAGYLYNLAVDALMLCGDYFFFNID